MNADITYATQQSGTVHHYRLAEGHLVYRCSNSELEFRLDLRKSEYAVKRTRHFSRFWYVGWVGVGFPLFTFGVIYLKEGVIDIGGSGWVHVGFLIVGVLLLIFCSRPVRVYEVRTGRGDRLRILADPTQPGMAERLVEAVKAIRVQQLEHPTTE